jgi:hypothetical protein
MNTDTITDGVIAVDYGMPLCDMIAAGKYDWVSPDITPEKFPVEGSGTKTFGATLFHFVQPISSEGAVAAMTAENFTPATHVHGLAFGAAFPDEQRKHSIVCLGSSALVLGLRLVVCLYGGRAGRHLNLGGWSGDWYNDYRFLAIREVSDE